LTYLVSALAGASRDRLVQNLIKGNPFSSQWDRQPSYQSLSLRVTDDLESGRLSAVQIYF